MFIGRYYHKLEDKGRVSLPKKFREIEQDWIITRGLDGGLFIFKKSDFIEKILKHLGLDEASQVRNRSPPTSLFDRSTQLF